ncbi:hypothetical protein FOCC_FOCC014027 [Frankliniella occidentalis]|nr:hypothetical protein FOCC_FOCC014027 [Frankliniella occidentalis]
MQLFEVIIAALQISLQDGGGDEPFEENLAQEGDDHNLNLFPGKDQQENTLQEGNQRLRSQEDMFAENDEAVAYIAGTNAATCQEEHPQNLTGSGSFVIIGHDLEVDSENIVMSSQVVLSLNADGDKCSFYSEGDSCDDPPHINCQQISREEMVALVWASGKFDSEEFSTICSSHYKEMLGDVLPDLPLRETKRNECCNPFKKHFSTITQALRKISLIFALKAKERGVSIKSNDHVCAKCRTEILSMEKQQGGQELKEASQNSDTIQKSESGSSYESPSIVSFKAKIKLEKFGVSPTFKFERYRQGRITAALKKIEDCSAVITKDICELYDVTEEELSAGNPSTDFREFLLSIKQLLPDSSTRRKVQLLTVCPLSWTPAQASKFFDASRYLIIKSRKLREDYGILSEPAPVHRKKISQETRLAVQEYYERDDVSRMMPGKKDCVSVARNVHKQKRLLLLNLNELYQQFLKDTELKIGLSFFCSLKPKWCVYAGAAGTHNVCVCLIHQNLKLLLHSLPGNIDFKSMIDELVCDKDSRVCRLRLCSQCPNHEQIMDVLTQKILTYLEIIPTAEDTDTEEEINAVMNDVVEYQQWVSTDRAELLTTSATILEVVDKTAKDLEKVIVHDFIAWKQSQYLLNEKENMPVSKAVILMDFSMNYSTTIQDVVQAQHWKKEQASVHPAVVYYKDESNALCLQSLCYISDDLDHDVAFVLVTQRYVTNYIKEKFPWIKEVEYMTDGCAKQYKNKQVFLNLSRHKEMFGLNASFSFFATSHGKSPCDGIGGTVKREATIASLQRPFDKQIIGAEKLFQFWKGRDSKIHFEFLSKHEIGAARIEQKLFGLQPTTIPGTRSFHKFVPIAGKISYGISL